MSLQDNPLINIKQTVSNSYPTAAVVFIQLDKVGAPLKDSKFTCQPDIDDIIQVSTTLGSTGNMGQFVIQINNENNKYFYADDIETEIKNLNNARQVQVEGTNIKTLPGDWKSDYAKIAWDNATDFLLKREFNRVYRPRTSGIDVAYFLYYEGNQLVYRPLAQKDLSALAQGAPDRFTTGTITTGSEFTLGQSESLGDPTIESTEAHKIVYHDSKQNAEFFESFGGQLEQGRCYFKPMQLCRIFLTPAVSAQDSTEPELILAFTGLVDSVTNDFNGERQILTIKGSDVTKWMQVTQSNVNPSLFTQGLPNDGAARIWTKTFAGMLGWQIIKVLTVGGADGSGNPVYGAGVYDTPKEIASPGSDATLVTQDDKDSAMLRKAVPTKTFARGILSRNAADTSKYLDQIFFSKSQIHLQVLPWDSAPGTTTAGPGEGGLSVYKNQIGGSFRNWQNEYASNLEIANEVASLTEFEFYADRAGDIWYHQPRYNNYHLLTDPSPETYVLREEDIIISSFTESDADVVTSVYVSPQFDLIQVEPEKLLIFAFWEDTTLVQKYGRRMESVSHPYLRATPEACRAYAKSYLVRRNASRFVGEVTILGRPELKMHMPVYVSQYNMIYYIVGITHNLVFGDKYTTTLSLKFGRKPWEILPELMNYDITTYAHSGESSARTSASTITTGVSADPRQVWIKNDTTLVNYRVYWGYQGQEAPPDLLHPADATQVAMPLINTGTDGEVVYIDVFGVDPLQEPSLIGEPNLATRYSRPYAAELFGVLPEDKNLRVLKITPIGLPYDTIGGTSSGNSSFIQKETAPSNNPLE